MALQWHTYLPTHMIQTVFGGRENETSAQWLRKCTNGRTRIHAKYYSIRRLDYKATYIFNKVQEMLLLTCSTNNIYIIQLHSLNIYLPGYGLPRRVFLLVYKLVEVHCEKLADNEIIKIQIVVQYIYESTESTPSKSFIIYIQKERERKIQ